MLMQDTATYLGPAVVREVREKEVRIDLHEEEAWARLAVSMPYRPHPGDTALVIGGDDGYYVIGVLEGSGPTLLSAPGDLELRADRGAVRLVSGRAVEVRAPKIRMLAGTLVQKLGEAFHWVRGMFQIRSRQSRTLVEETSYQKSGHAYVLAEKDVKIDGERIHLG